MKYEVSDSEQAHADKVWGVGEWEIHPCPFFDDLRLVIHSKRFHDVSVPAVNRYRKDRCRA